MTSPNDTFAVLAPNLVVSGNLVSEGNIHIDGTVEGDVQTVHLCVLPSISHSSSKDVFGGVKIPSSSNMSHGPGNTASI